MKIKLRSHQSELNSCIDGIISGSKRFKSVKRIIISACPGSGKGSCCVNAGKLIKAGLADNICLIVPRTNLQLQAEQVCMDTFFQKLFNVNISLRASTNDYNPTRGLHGFISTYQALGHDKRKHVLEIIKKRRYILIQDEFHHVEEDSPWADSVGDLMEAAKYVILMSGTLSRANKKQIAFMKYKNGYVDLKGDKETYVIRYPRSEALKELAVLPMKFHLYDGSFEWEAHNGKKVAVQSFASVQRTDRSSALFTALETEFSNQLIDRSLVHWLKAREKNPRSKILFICARIGDARRCMSYLTGLNVPSLLVTSHGDHKECIQNIEKYKANAPVMVTIAIGYEGLDVPAMTHVCVLTRIRSHEWLEQACSRPTRHDKKAGPYSSQIAHVFAPKDQAFLEFVDVIEKEQVTRANTGSIEEQLPLFELPSLNEGGSEQGPCKPLRSQIIDLAKGFNNQKVVWERKVLTPKQEEMDIRHDIDRYLKRYARDQGYEVMEVNRSAKEINQKPRNLMTLDELRYFFNRIQILFPLVSRGSFVPISNCQPIFDSKQKEFNLESESFF